ncbi:DUF1524 domain-containing protein [Bdellovibrio sp.]|uniref:GmrSD restriction endonuclease domain-containing protein n=1 Tax=Bdellovibrio sp. TaxID=28201 RepID=UPI0039E2EA18
MKSLKWMIIFAMWLASFAHAQPLSSTAAPKNEPVYREYYTIDERNLDSEAGRKISHSGFNEFSAEFGPDQFLQAAKKLLINLLKWTLHSEERPQPIENYMRKLHFGRWINDPTDDTCMNTRAKVLVRDSEQDVTFRNQRNCVVESGKWLDPYSNQELTSSKDIQIDHMVPLKHAYLAGAWQWDYKTRCLYANYMGYRNHLVPSTVRENTSKGDRAPDKYLPSELSYRCQYVKDWLAIKLIWKLNMTTDEVQAIHEVVTNYNCNISDFRLSKEEIEEQRQYINSNLEFCMINKR